MLNMCLSSLLKQSFNLMTKALSREESQLLRRVDTDESPSENVKLCAEILYFLMCLDYTLKGN